MCEEKQCKKDVCAKERIENKVNFLAAIVAIVGVINSALQAANKFNAWVAIVEIFLFLIVVFLFLNPKKWEWIDSKQVVDWCGGMTMASILSFALYLVVAVLTNGFEKYLEFYKAYFGVQAVILGEGAFHPIARIKKWFKDK